MKTTTAMDQTIVKLEELLRDAGAEYRIKPVHEELNIGWHIFMKVSEQNNDSEIVWLSLNQHQFTLKIPNFCLNFTDEYKGLKASNQANAHLDAGRFFYNAKQQNITYAFSDYLTANVMDNIEAIEVNLFIATKNLDFSYALMKSEYEKD